jgi:hypothetical protein
MRRVQLALALLLAAGLTGACSSTSDNPPATGQSAVPRVWPLPADPAAAAAKAGLPMLGEEMLEVHYHAHLDVTVRGVTIVVPAGIGIDNARHAISPLHTHDTTGIVHIESAEDLPFTLGQLFTEWGQPLSTSQVGPVKAGPDEEVRLYRNGTRVAGDSAALKLTAHDELVVWLGQKGEQPQVRRSYPFPNGL